MSDKRVHTAPSNPRIEADKPAATVHGTGSGEATCADQRCCGCGKRYQEHAGRDNLCYTDGRTVTFVPTPPASPTVTQLARVAELLEELKFCSMSSGAQVRVSELRDIVALLRAAERQQ